LEFFSKSLASIQVVDFIGLLYSRRMASAVFAARFILRISVLKLL
jgi:hypothetical protein